MEKQSICAVVVTYNRINLLMDCVDALRRQTKRIDEIIIIDNSSTDGTLEWLSKQKDVTVITQANTGSAGGFYTGIKTAYEKGYEWIWCMDDDVKPESNALEELDNFIESSGEGNLGFVCSKVLSVNRSLHPWNKPGFFWNKKFWNFIGDENVSKSYCEVDACSFVSVMFNSKAIQSVGFPNQVFYLYFDDFEYTLKFKNYKNYFISNSIVTHYSSLANAPSEFYVDEQSKRKAYFYIRNVVSVYWNYNKIHLLVIFLRTIAKAIYKYLKSQVRGDYFIFYLKTFYTGIRMKN